MASHLNMIRAQFVRRGGRSLQNWAKPFTPGKRSRPGLIHARLRGSFPSNQYIRSIHEMKDISFLDMDPRDLREISSVTELEELVKQVESVDDSLLSSVDVEPLIIPLMGVTSDSNRFKDAKTSAMLTQRLLVACLSRLGGYDSSYPFPTVEMYNRCIIAWGSIRSWEGAERAQSVWEMMIHERNKEIQWRTENDQDIETTLSASPNRQSYKSLLRAYAISNDARGPDRARNILGELEDVSGVPCLLNEKEDEGGVDLDLLPDSACYDIVLNAYASQRITKEDGNKNILKCFQIASRMENIQQVLSRDDVPMAEEYQLTGMTYEGLFRAYQSHLDVAESINKQIPLELIQLLRRVELNLKSAHGIPGFSKLRLAHAYGITIESFIRAGRTRQAHEVLTFLTGEAFLAGLPVIRKGDLPPLPTLLRLLRALEDQGHVSLLEDVVEVISEIRFGRPYELNKALRQIMNGYSSWPLTPRVMEVMLNKAFENPEWNPTGESFALVMGAWLNADLAESPVRCETLLETLMNMKARECQAKQVHVELAMRSWMSKLSTGDLARGCHGYQWPAAHVESVFRDAVESGLVKNIPRMASLVMEAWAKQNVPFTKTDKRLPDPVDRSLILVNDVKSSSTDPVPSKVANWFLQLCCKRFRTSTQRQRAFREGLEMFGKMERNPYSYLLLIRLFRNHRKKGVSDEEKRVLVKAFRECSAQGMLSQQFVWGLLALEDADLVSSVWTLPLEDSERLVEVCRTHLTHKHGKYQWRNTANVPTVLNVAHMPPEWCSLVPDETNRV